MISMVMEFVRNCSFTLTTGSGKHIKLWRLKDVVQQGSVLTPLLHNIYIHELPVATAKMFVCVHDLVILHLASNWQALKEAITQNMATLSSHLHL